MATRTSPPRHRGNRLAWTSLVLAAVATAAAAQTCTPALPTPGAVPAAGGGKFSLIESSCPALAEPAQVRRAAQLDLYSASVSLDGTSAPAAPLNLPPVMLPAPAPALDAPIGRDGQRVLSLAPALTAAARANDLDPLLLHAIAHVESRHNPNAVSPAGARGVMQVMPATAQRFGVTDPQRSLLDPQTNVNASAALLRTLRARYGDDLRLVLAAYNAGEGAVEKHGRNVPPYAETQAYVRDVLAIYRRLGAAFSVDANGALVARGSRS